MYYAADGSRTARIAALITLLLGDPVAPFVRMVLRALQEREPTAQEWRDECFDLAWALAVFMHLRTHAVDEEGERLGARPPPCLPPPQRRASRRASRRPTPRAAPCRPAPRAPRCPPALRARQPPPPRSSHFPSPSPLLHTPPSCTAAKACLASLGGRRRSSERAP